MNLIFSYLKPYRWYLALALLLAAINQIFSLLDPQIFRLLVDNYASKAGQISVNQFMQGVGLLMLASVGVAFVSRVAKNFQDYFVSLITQRVSTRLYEYSVAHAFSLPFSVLEDNRSGELLQKLQKARTDIQVMIANFVNIVFLSLIGILFVLGYAYFIDWRVGLAYTSLIPILGFSTFVLTSRIRLLQKNIVAQTAALAGSTTETLRNVELVKSLGLEGQEISRLNQVNTKILGLELGKIRSVRTISFFQGTLINAARSGLLALMLWLVASGELSLGQLFSLLFYSFFIFGPLGELGNIASQFQEARASMEQLQSILSLPAEEKPENAKVIGEVKDILVENLSFVYQDNQTKSLTDISLHIPAGQTVAFVGPSGSGKSTLIKLLVGLYAPTEGDVRINQTSMSEIDIDDYRKRIGFVAQETQLFAGTIRENLLFVKPAATDAECMAVLEAAQATAIVEREGGAGLDTRIGEGGVKISGGERQRLAIARALLRDPEVLIFDEATSSLDSLTESEITETIKKITTTRPNLITIMVAHRLSTIIHADTIYVFEKSHLVEQGTHAALLAENGLYSALWRQQSAES